MRRSRQAAPARRAYSRDFRGPNWLDLRKAAAAYTDRDPTVLVVGGGQAGLSIAARLGQLGVDTLIVDRLPRIGDNWRKRYHALTLHNQVHVNHLPYMPFPPTWPAYIPKDKLASWFEAYVESLELNYWTGDRIRRRQLRRQGGSLVGAAAPRRRHEARDASAPHRHGDRRRAASRTSRTFRRSRTSAARCCTPANTTTARPGRARARWSSAPATAATTSPRISIRAAPR